MNFFLMPTAKCWLLVKKGENMKRMYRMKGNVLILVLIALCLTLCKVKAEEPDFTEFFKALEYLKTYYVDPQKVESNRLKEGALKGMVLAVDPLGDYWLKKDYELVKRQINSVQKEIGIRWTIRDKMYVVKSVLEGSPAAFAGIQVGDMLAEINGKDVLPGMTVTNLNLLGKDDRDISISLKFYRKNATEPLEFNLQNKTISRKVVAYTFENGIGYLKPVELTAGIKSDLTNALRNFNDKKVQSIIIDLRNVCDGDIDTADYLAGSFFQNGLVLAKVQDAAKQIKPVTIKSVEPNLTQIPLVVLINEGTVGIPEVLASAFSEYKRALLIGSPTVGLVERQEILNLGEDRVINVTTGYYLTANEKQIQGKGIAPDDKVVETVQDYAKRSIENDNLIKKAKELLEVAKIWRMR